MTNYMKVREKQRRTEQLNWRIKSAGTRKHLLSLQLTKNTKLCWVKLSEYFKETCKFLCHFMLNIVLKCRRFISINKHCPLILSNFLLILSALFTCVITLSRSTSGPPNNAIEAYQQTTCGQTTSSGPFCPARDGKLSGRLLQSQKWRRLWSTHYRQHRIWWTHAKTHLNYMVLILC